MKTTRPTRRHCATTPPTPPPQGFACGIWVRGIVDPDFLPAGVVRLQIVPRVGDNVLVLRGGKHRSCLVSEVVLMPAPFKLAANVYCASFEDATLTAVTAGEVLGIVASLLPFVK